MGNSTYTTIDHIHNEWVTECVTQPMRRRTECRRLAMGTADCKNAIRTMPWQPQQIGAMETIWTGLYSIV